jgi:DNA-binding NtrC family response regulator
MICGGEAELAEPLRLRYGNRDASVRGCQFDYQRQCEQQESNSQGFRDLGHYEHRVEPKSAEAMLGHSWPGNVRELENMMRRFLVYQDARLLTAELTEPVDPPKLRLAVTRTPATSITPVNGGRVSFDHFAETSRTAESKLLLDTLEAVRWNRRQAALQLNIDYKALLYKLQKHGIVESKAKRREVSA